MATSYSLYDQLGGEPALLSATHFFYSRVKADERVSDYFTGVDMRCQQVRLAMFMCNMFQGASVEGVNLRKAHEHLDLSEDAFDIIAQHLEDTLTALFVADDLKYHAMAIIRSTKSVVLNQ